MNGMMVTVPTNVAHEPRAPRIPNFLFQNPRNKSAPNSHSETPKEPTRAADAEYRVQPENKRAVADVRDQHLCLVLPAFLIAKGQEDDDHRCAQQVIVKIIFEQAKPDQYACEGVHDSLPVGFTKLENLTRFDTHPDLESLNPRGACRFETRVRGLRCVLRGGHREFLRP